MDRAELDRVWTEVKDNRARLDSCGGPHDFCLDANPEREVFKSWRCSKCGGMVNHEARHWYELGMAHGRRSA